MADAKRAIALGFFDGVHIGHAALLNKTNERAAEYGFMPSVLSFDVHPDDLVFGGRVKLINSALGRESVIKRSFGITNVVFIHFNQHIMRMPWQDFAELIIGELNIGWIVVGHDFSFGYKGEGTALKLREYCAERGIGCDIIAPVMLDGVIVSSTRIRQLISEGDIGEANRFLGHPHFITDTVHSGYHLGTKLGTPTINMSLPDGVVVPKYGVYATKAYIDGNGSYISVTNVGVRPTIGESNAVTVESHLLDYSGNLYGRQARVDFFDFLREERKFESYEELAAQIQRDAQAAREYFNDKDPVHF